MFNELLIRPIYNLLVFLYNIIPGNDMGIAIILLTIVIRLVLAPLTIRSQRAQRELAKLNPKLQEIKAKFKNDQAAQGAAIMQLYKDHNINPLSGCLPTLLQIPIMLALYRVFLTVFESGSLSMLYTFIPNPGTINAISMGFLDITIRNPFLAVVTGVLQFLYGWYIIKSQGTSSPSASMNLPMLYLFPVLVVSITWRFPAGLAFYWITVTLYSMLEQFYVVKRFRS